MTFLTIDQKDEETWHDQQEDKDIGSNLVIDRHGRLFLTNWRLVTDSQSDLDSICISCDVWWQNFVVFFRCFFSNFVISGAKYDYGQLRRQIMKSRSDGKDWWRWSRSVQKDFKPTAHFPAFIDTLSCNLVLGIALFWWKGSRTMLSLDHASSIIEWKYCSWLFSSNKREVITQGNIAKGTTDPRVEFILQVFTQILIKFHLKNLEQVSTSKSQPNISLSIKLKLQNCDTT